MKLRASENWVRFAKRKVAVKYASTWQRGLGLGSYGASVLPMLLQNRTLCRTGRIDAIDPTPDLGQPILLRRTRRLGYGGNRSSAALVDSGFGEAD